MTPQNLNRFWEMLKAKKSPNVMFSGAHGIHTPRELCKEITSKIDVQNRNILVLYNIEFVLTLVYDFDVDPNNITFLSDHTSKSLYVSMTGVKSIITNLEATQMKFDVVIGNPPYKFGNEKGGKSSLWRRIVSQAWSLTNKDGAMAMVTPNFQIRPRIWDT